MTLVRAVAKFTDSECDGEDRCNRDSSQGCQICESTCLFFLVAVTVAAIRSHAAGAISFASGLVFVFFFLRKLVENCQETIGTFFSPVIQFSKVLIVSLDVLVKS